VLHDIEAVRRHFPETLLLAREKVAHGATDKVLTAENLFRARQMSEAFDDNANVCMRPPTRGAA
ncbi:MAG: ABC transporter, partial [Cereibacter sp.]